MVKKLAKSICVNALGCVGVERIPKHNDSQELRINKKYI